MWFLTTLSLIPDFPRDRNRKYKGTSCGATFALTGSSNRKAAGENVPLFFRPVLKVLKTSYILPCGLRFISWGTLLLSFFFRWFALKFSRNNVCENLFFQVTSFGVFFCRTKTKESFISLNNEVTEALLGGAGQSSMSKLLLLCCLFLAFSLWSEREARSKFAFFILMTTIVSCVQVTSTETYDCVASST